MVLLITLNQYINNMDLGLKKHASIYPFKVGDYPKNYHMTYFDLVWQSKNVRGDVHIGKFGAQIQTMCVLLPHLRPDIFLVALL